MHKISESTIEDAALAWFENLGYGILFSPHIAFDSYRSLSADSALFISEH